MIKINTREDFLIELDEYLPRQCKCVEIGVLYGDFSELILKIIIPECLVLIDPYLISESKYSNDINSLTTAYSTEQDYQNVLHRFRNEIASEQVIINRKYSYEAVDYFADGSLDFVYIDGSHLYLDVKRDLNDWLPKLGKDGLMSGHDNTPNYKLEVGLAVDDFCKEHNFQMIIFNENGGDWALKRKQ